MGATTTPNKLSKIHAVALAKTYLQVVERGEVPEIVESFRKAVVDIWRSKYEYYKDEEVFRELVKRKLLPAKPQEG
jgi:acetolactate synthase small subunit